MARSFLPFLFASILAALIAAHANAISPAELSRILDAPQMQISLQTFEGEAVEANDSSYVGGSSLKFTPQPYDIGNLGEINSKLTIAVTEPGRLSVKVRGDGHDPSFIRVEGSKGYASIPKGTEAGHWYTFSFFIEAGVASVRLAVDTLNVPKDSAFFVDTITFDPGATIIREDIPAAGRILVSPDKELYALDELVTVSIEPNPDVVSASIVARNNGSNEMTTYPSSFQFHIDRSTKLTAEYTLKMDIPGLDARVKLSGRNFSGTQIDGFTIEGFELHNIPGKSKLRFEAERDFAENLDVFGGDVLYVDGGQYQEWWGDSDCKKFDATIGRDEALLRFDFAPYFASQYPPELRFRAFELFDTPEAIAETRGKGEVSVTYQAGKSPNTVEAHFAATPSPGWEFFRWTGEIESRKAVFDAVLDHPTSIVAEFVQTFDFGPVHISLLHLGDTDIRLNEAGDGIELSTSNAVRQVILFADIDVAGPFSITKANYDKQTGDFAYSESLFAQPTSVAIAPLRLSRSIAVYPENRIELRDIIAGGGDSANDVSLAIVAPAGSVLVDPSQAPYASGETIRLSIDAAFRDRFAGWGGSVYGTNPDLSVKLDGPKRIEAIFEESFGSPEKLELNIRGPASLPLGTIEDQRISLAAAAVPPESWTEVEVPSKSHFAGFTLSGDASLNNLHFWQGWEPIATERISMDGDSLFCPIDPSRSDQPIRIRFHNDSSAPSQFGIAFNGYFQDTKTWIPTSLSDKVLLNPAARFAPVGSDVKATPTPPEGFVFERWADSSLDPNQRVFTVPYNGPVDLTPLFNFANSPEGMRYLPGVSSPWSYSSDIFSDFSIQLRQGVPLETLALDVSGPAVVTFKANTAHGSVLFNVTSDGEPARYGDFGITGDLDDQEVLVESGEHRIAINIVNENPDYFFQPLVNLREVRLYAGYGVGSLKDYPYRVRTDPAATPTVYPKSTTVTISPAGYENLPGAKWVGDLAGATMPATVNIDRHIIANPIHSRNFSVGGVSIIASPDAQFLTNPYSTDSLTSITAYPISGPCSFIATVPSGTEFVVSMSGADEVPITVLVNGEPIYEGPSVHQLFGFPVKPEPFTVEIRAQLDPASLMGLTIDFQAYTTFGLYGDFGSEQEYVLAEPDKDTYNLGEKVTVKLGNSVPSGYVFYDTAAYLPNLGQVEWLDVDGKTSFEVEIVSETILVGNVGKLPARPTDQAVAQRGAVFGSTTEKAPDGRSIQIGTQTDPTSCTLRIPCRSAKQIDFWLMVPIYQSVIFPDSITADTYPVFVEGDGGWHKVSLSVPDDTPYLTGFVSFSVNRAPFAISTIKKFNGYGIPFVSSAGGDVVFQPANGVARRTDTLAIVATPDDGYEFSSWLAQDEDTATQRTYTPASSPTLYPKFAKLPSVRKDGYLTFQTNDPAPSFANATGDYLFTLDGSTLLIEMTGPGRFHYTVSSTSGATLTSALDGALLHTHKQYPTYQNPASPEFIVPSGHHTLTFTYSAPGELNHSTLSNINYEPGATLDFGAGLSDSFFTIEPDKRFFAPNETVRITANPRDNAEFDRWVGDLADQPRQRSITLTPSDNITVDAFYRNELTYSNGADWKISNSFDEPNEYVAVAEAEGPAYIALYDSEHTIARTQAYIDGLAIALLHDDQFAYLCVPAGRHQLKLKSNNGSSPILNSTFQSGYLLAVAGDTSLLQLDPKQLGYSSGANVALSPSLEHALSSNDLLEVDGVPYPADSSIEFTVKNHRVLQVKRLRRIPGTSFYLDREVSSVAVRPNSATGLPALELPYEWGDTKSVSAKFEGPGELRFTLGGIAGSVTKQLVDGRQIAQYLTNGSYSITLADGPTWVEWRFENPSYSGVLASLSDVHLEQDELPPYQTWLAKSIPSYATAIGEKLEPEDDFDGDGRSNDQEWREHTSPTEYDIPVRIFLNASGKRTIGFELSASTDLNTVSILARIESNAYAYWRPIPLGSVDVSIEADGAQRRIYVPVDQLPADATLFRIGVALDK